VLPWATGPLTLLESIAKVPDRQSRQNRQIVYLLTFFFFFFFLLSVTVRQASTITAEAITTIQSRKNIIIHRVLHPPPIARNELGMVGEFQNCMLAYIRHFSE